MSGLKLSDIDAVTFSGCGALNFYQTGVGYGLQRAQQTYTFRGLPCIDGGFSNNQPAFGSRCLKVSPFWFHPRSHIKPNIGVRPDYAMRVPTEQRAWWLFNRGAEDCERFAKREFIDRARILQSLREELSAMTWMRQSKPSTLKSVFRFNRH